jgi:hypothetical protein
MPTRPVADVEAALLLKGMQQDENHHHMFRKEIDGVTTLVTRTSHNAQEINDHLAGLMGKQLCLQQREFWQLVDCPLGEEEWDALIAARCPDGRNPFIGH